MTKGKPIGARVPPELKEAVEDKAQKKDLTVSQVIRRLLRRWIAENGDEEGEG